MAKVRDVSTVTYRPTIVRDPHGRAWEVLLDPDTFVPCALPIPKFRAPLEVPPKFLVFSSEQLGQCGIRYDLWAAEWAGADEEYTRLLRQAARAQFNLELASVPADKLPALYDAVGEPPQSVEFVHAAAAGNRWVLGLASPATGQPYPAPQWATPILARIAPRWAQLRPEDRAARAAVDRAKYADEDGATPALGATTLDPDAVDGATPTDNAGAFADEVDYDRLTGDAPAGGGLTTDAGGADAGDPDPDGLAAVATTARRRR